MLELRYFPGEAVSLIEPKINGHVKEIHIYEDYRVTYTVRYWVNGDMYAGDFTASEIEQIIPHEVISVGFNKKL